ncbi:MAG: hypothetical protein H7293_09780 [Candidatus Saccharibacteria bacterium]|nr:hypothetical protein [Rhodoferax sp.]
MFKDPIPFGAKRVLQQAVEMRYEDRQHYRDAILLELIVSQEAAFPKVLETLDLTWEKLDEQAKHVASDDDLWQVVEHLLDHADFSVTRNPDDGKMLKRWAHQPPQTLDGKKDVDESADMENLAICAENYLKAGWAKSPTFELWLVRKMIYSETFALSREIGVPLRQRSGKFWWMWAKSTVMWAIGLAVSISIGDSHGVAAGVLTYVIWISLTKYLASAQIDTLKSNTRTFLQMRTAYVVALRTLACPVEIEKALSVAESHETIWPTGLRALVERAISRNREIWC